MANPEYHARSSSRRFGGRPDDYLEMHQFWDQTKSHHAGPAHRMILHNSFGIFVAEQVFGSREESRRLREVLGSALSLLPEDIASELRERIPRGTPVTFGRESDGHQVPIRVVGEQHVEEDLGRIPSLAEVIELIPKESWMYRRARPLSEEL